MKIFRRLLLLFAAASFAFAQFNDGGRQVAKGSPAPRTSDGHIDFSGVYHAPGYGPGDPPVKNGETIARNIARDLKPEDVPLLPSAIETMRQRAEQNSKDDPEGLCLPMGTPRKDPYPWKIVQTPPNVIDTWWGDSVGHWDGDALVVDTVGLNDKAWLDLIGHPRTAKAHIIERFTRPELGRMNVEITIDDPGAYSKPWKVFESSQLAPGWEITEYICNENNRDVSHLVGK